MNLPTRQLLFAYLLERAKTGYSNGEISFPGYTLKEIRKATDRLIAKGLLFNARVTFKNSRYFDTKEKAEAFLTAIQRRYEAKPAQPSIVIHPRQKAKWGPDAPMVFTKDTKRTVCPSFTPARPWTNTHSPL